MYQLRQREIATTFRDEFSLRITGEAMAGGPFTTSAVAESAFRTRGGTLRESFEEGVGVSPPPEKFRFSVSSRAIWDV